MRPSTDPIPLTPLIPRDFPDPDVVETADGLYAYSTNSGYGGQWWHVPTQRSASLIGPWREVGDAMPTLPGWVDAGRPNVWAPELAEAPDGAALLYFTARNAALGVQCIGVATASSPAGPFTGVGTGPLVGRAEDGDSLDAESVVDADGRRYLLYKSGRRYSTMWLQRLTPGGLGVEGERVAVLRSDRPEEAGVIEAPSLVRRDDRYVLFYSANRFDSGRYFVNYATAPALAGPYTKADGALLTADTVGRSHPNPGHQDVLLGADGDALVVHASINQTDRAMFAVGLGWTPDGRPEVRPLRPADPRRA